MLLMQVESCYYLTPLNTEDYTCQIIMRKPCIYDWYTSFYLPIIYTIKILGIV